MSFTDFKKIVISVFFERTFVQINTTTATRLNSVKSNNMAQM